MQVMKWSVIALAVAAGTTQMAVASSQSESKGFIEDSSFDIFSRALYHNRDFRNGAQGNSTSDGGRKGYREEFGLGVRLLLESGFTQGTVGVGFDAHSLSSVKLDTGKGRVGLGQFDEDSQGRGEDTQSEVGGAIKFRISDTVLKHGNMMVDTPVFSTDDSRILPEVATGTFLTSNEIAGLEVNVGRFTALSAQESTDRDTAELKSINFGGASYSITDDLSVSAYASRVEDAFNKRYLGANYNIPMGEDQSLNFDFNFYRTTDTGKEIEGKIDNKIWSLATAYNIGAHTFTLAHQRSSGDNGYVYGLDGGGTIYLENAVYHSDFEKEDERSWKAQYNLDMTDYGVPGLSFMTRYVKGTNITTRDDDGLVNRTDAKETEFNVGAKYVVQAGPAKDLSILVRHATYRANSEVDKDVNDFRIVLDYPLSVL